MGWERKGHLVRLLLRSEPKSKALDLLLIFVSLCAWVKSLVISECFYIQPLLPEIKSEST